MRYTQKDKFIGNYITQTNLIGDNQVSCFNFAEDNNYLINETKLVYVGKPIDKLAELEDFMEQEGFENIAEMHNTFGFIRFSDGYNEETGEEIHKQEFIKYADAYKERVKAYKNLYNKMKKLKDKWNKLKDWVNEQYRNNLVRRDNADTPPDIQEYCSGSIDRFKLILDKMEEFEKEENDG